MAKDIIIPKNHGEALDEARQLAVRAGDLIAAQFVSAMNGLERDADDFEEVLKRVGTLTESTAERGADFKKAVTGAISRYDDIRKAIQSPLGDIVKLVNGQFKPFLDRLTIVKSCITAKLDNYAAEVERSRRAAEDVLAAAKADDSPVGSEVVTALAAPSRVISDNGTSLGSSRKVSGELLDARALLGFLAKLGTDDELKGVEIKKSLLNKLAIEAASDEGLGELPVGEHNGLVPGVLVKVETKANVR